MKTNQSPSGAPDWSGLWPVKRGLPIMPPMLGVLVLLGSYKSVIASPFGSHYMQPVRQPFPRNWASPSL